MEKKNNLNTLVLSTLRSFLIGVVILGILLFLPAGTLNYWQAWVFIGVFTTSVNAIGVFLSLKDPALLERRKKVGPKQETSTVQKIIMSIAFIAIPGLFVFCAFDYRFAWSPVPAVGVFVGDALITIAFLILYFVFKENSFGGSTVETVDAQKVISTGPYALVRHPMYVGVLVMMVGVPIALGSWWGLAVLALVVPGLTWRILDEEKLLKKDLPGYNEYTQKVHYRLVPYLW